MPYVHCWGWLRWPNPNQWTLNSSGIVSSGGETYILVVYAQNQPAYDWSMIDHIGAAVAQLLG